MVHSGRLGGLKYICIGILGILLSNSPLWSDESTISDVRARDIGLRIKLKGDWIRQRADAPTVMRLVNRKLDNNLMWLPSIDFVGIKLPGKHDNKRLIEYLQNTALSSYSNQKSTGIKQFRAGELSVSMCQVSCNRPLGKNEHIGAVKEILEQEVSYSICLFVFHIGDDAYGAVAIGSQAESKRYEDLYTKAIESMTIIPKWEPKKDLLAERASFPTNLRKFNVKTAPLTNIRGVQKVTYESDGRKLAAYLILPGQRNKAFPGIVYAHSDTSIDPWEPSLLVPLLKAGFALFIPTFRGEHGNNGQQEFLWGEVDDLVAAGNHLANIQGIDPKRISLIGVKQGGTLAMLTAMVPSNYHKMFSICGSPDVLDLLNFRTTLPFDPSDSRELTLRSPMYFPSSLRTPLDLMVGMDDRVILAPNRKFQRAAEKLGKECRVHTVPGDEYIEGACIDLALTLLVDPKEIYAPNKDLNLNGNWAEVTEELGKIQGALSKKSTLGWAEMVADNLYEKVTQGPGLHPQRRGLLLTRLGQSYLQLSRSDRARDCLLGALKDYGKDEHVSRGDIYRTLCNLEFMAGDGEKSIEYGWASVDCYKKEPGYGFSRHGIAANKTIIARVMQDLGRIREAEALFLELAEEHASRTPPEPRAVASAWSGLGDLYRKLGMFDDAEAAYRRVLVVTKQTYGPTSTRTFDCLRSLAAVLRQAGRFDEAKAVCDELKELTPPGIRQANYLHTYSAVLMGLGELDQAYDYQKQALQLVQQMPNVPASRLAGEYHSLGWLAIRKGDYDEAIKLLEKTQDLESKGSDVGKELLIANTKFSMAVAQALKGNASEAYGLLKTGNTMIEKELGKMGTVGNEKQKLAFMQKIVGKTDFTIQFFREFNPQSPESGKLAFETVLQRKGRVQEMIANGLSALRGRANDDQQAMLKELSVLRSKSASMRLRSASQEEVSPVETQINKLEHLLHKEGLLQSSMGQLTIPAVAGEIGEDGLLLEYAFYRPFKPKVADKDKLDIQPRCVCFALSGDGKVYAFDVGDEATLTRLINDLKKGLLNKSDIRHLAQKLHDIVILPALKRFPGKSRLIVAPDGILNFLPFGALQNGSGKHVIASNEVVYLCCGRDLLRQKHSATTAGSMKVYAAPTYTTKQPDAIAEHGLQFSPLPGTMREAEALQGMFPKAVIKTGEQASEKNVKSGTFPQILHIATHGFFLDAPPMGERTRGLKRVKTEKALPVKDSRTEIFRGNPLVRSGLAFSGANNSATEEDGLLTAYEIVGLDMSRTELVVLSACDTGVGSVLNGSSVFGLRRALSLAGSRTQVMSLWPVHDDATCQLMIAFYKNLKAGKGRAQAMREAQLELLQSEQYRHPLYWGAFIVAGDWKPLELK